MPTPVAMNPSVQCGSRSKNRSQATFHWPTAFMRSQDGVGMAEAADLLGFSSGSAFSRWFLVALGKRPSEWRKEYGMNGVE